MNVVSIVTKVRIVPIAGYDSPTLTLSGCHYPFFIRNIVIIEDDSGNKGIAEIHGGEPIKKSLESYIPFIVGHDITDYRNIIKNIQKKLVTQMIRVKVSKNLIFRNYNMWFTLKRPLSVHYLI